jgi:hypothetical protein
VLDEADLGSGSQVAKPQFVNPDFFPPVLAAGVGDQRGGEITRDHRQVPRDRRRKHVGLGISGHPRELAARQWQSQTIAHVLVLPETLWGWSRPPSPDPADARLLALALQRKPEIPVSRRSCDSPVAGKAGETRARFRGHSLARPAAGPN